ncbi:MAG TPA: hypothetical protein VH143_32500 [Kofleriaceae bacterium]|nr:hypothetical protein [Kofleriaceae bacterium]
MGTPTDKMDPEMKKARQDDGGDFDRVNSVQDLEVDKASVNSARVKDHQDSLIKPDAVGFFQEGAADFSRYADAPLKLGSKVMADGGGRLAEYEAGYNIYAQPLRSSVRAMGRVKDVSNAGAPMTPAELQANPKMKARFRQLSLTEHADSGAQTAYAAWSQEMTNFRLDIKSYQAGQMQLAAATSNWDRIQAVLKQQRKESERAGKQSELNEIDEAAETLARIVEVSAEALTAAGEISEAMEASTAIDESAAETAMEPEVSHENEGLTTTAKATNKAASAASQASDAKNIVSKVTEMAGKAGPKDLSINLQNVFVIAMGNGGKKLQLEADIEKLTKQIQNLKMTQVEDDIRAGKQALEGFNLEVSVRQQKVQTSRSESRKGAQVFNQSLTGADQVGGEMAMMSAEAHIELAEMGRLADQERKILVDPHWRWADAYINDNHSRLDGMGEQEDRKALAMNIFQVRDQRTYFEKNLPKWQQTSQQWQRFLSEMGQSSFLNNAQTKNDRKDDAP